MTKISLTVPDHNNQFAVDALKNKLFPKVLCLLRKTKITDPEEELGKCRQLSVLCSNNWDTLQEPLYDQDDENVLYCKNHHKKSFRTKQRTQHDVKVTRTPLASTRIERDALLRDLESISLQEMEVKSALDVLVYNKQRCCKQYMVLLKRLDVFTVKFSVAVEGREAICPSEWVDVNNKVLDSDLPKMLIKLKENIEVNEEKLKRVQFKLCEIQAKRYILQYKLQEKECTLSNILETVVAQKSIT